jgi:phosphohistidine phosphatase SixA
VGRRQLLHSGKRRAEQAAEILADYLMPAKGATVLRGFGPDDDVRPLAASLTATKTG